MARRNYVLNHKRVSTYRVTHNERYNNFMVQPNLIYEDEILFVYNENGAEIQGFYVPPDTCDRTVHFH